MTVREGSISQRYDRETYLKAVTDISGKIDSVPVTTQDPLAIVLKFVSRTLRHEPQAILSCNRAYSSFQNWSLLLGVEPIPHAVFSDNLNHFVDEVLTDKVKRVKGADDDVYHGLTI
jgi:hypothetical protein